MKVAIIDDELSARDNLKLTINGLFDDLEIVGEADSVSSGKTMLTELEIDLLFLDIDMADGSGFTLLETLKEVCFQVIFVTAYNNYAMEAFKANALDYILKPIEDRELNRAVNRVRQIMIENNFSNLLNTSKIGPKLTVKDSEGIKFIEIETIERCQADKNYTEIYLDSGERIVSSKTLKEYTDTLETHLFFRIHQSHLINLNKIRRIVRDHGMYVELLSGQIVEVSRRRKDAFLNCIKAINI